MTSYGKPKDDKWREAQLRYEKALNACQAFRRKVLADNPEYQVLEEELREASAALSAQVYISTWDNHP